MKEVLLAKISESDLDDKSADFIRAIADTSENVALKLMSAVIPKIATADVDWQLGDFVRNVAFGHEKLASALGPALSARLAQAEVGRGLGECIAGVAGFIDDAGKAAIVSLAFGAVIRRISEETDFEKIMECITPIALWKKELALKLVPVLGERLRVEPNVANIAMCLAISVASKEFGKAIFAELRSETQQVFIRDPTRRKKLEELGVL